MHPNNRLLLIKKSKLNFKNQPIKYNPLERLLKQLPDALILQLDNEEEGYQTIAEPIGVIAGVTPVTNPTATVMFKSMISAKTRNVQICNRCF